MADSDSDRSVVLLAGRGVCRTGRRVYVDTIRDTSHRTWSVVGQGVMHSVEGADG